MRALAWTLVWVTLLLAGAGYLWAAVRRSWRSLRALGAEVEVTERRLAQAQAGTHAAAGPTPDPAGGAAAGSPLNTRGELALFRDRASLRAERAAARRSLRERRRSQRERSRPAWARRVDS